MKIFPSIPDIVAISKNENQTLDYAARIVARAKKENKDNIFAVKFDIYQQRNDAQRKNGMYALLTPDELKAFQIVLDKAVEIVNDLK